MKWKLLAAVGCILVVIAGGITYGIWYLFSDPDRAEVIKCMTEGAQIGFLLGLGEDAMDGKRYTQAERYFRQALAQAQKSKDNKSNCAEAMTRIAQCLRRQKKTSEALQAFEKAATLYEEAEDEELIHLTSDKKIRLICLTEYCELLNKTGRKETAEEIQPEMETLKEEINSAKKGEL